MVKQTSGKNLQPKYALVKWLTGRYEGQFTHDVHTSWIRDFDPKSDFQDESFIIEWRVPPKPSCGDWDVYDGCVVAAHDELGYLEGLKHQEEHKLNEKEKDKDPNKNTPQNGRKTFEKSPSVDGTPKSKNLESILAQLLVAVSPSVSGTPTQPTPSSVDEEYVKIGKNLKVRKSCYLEARAAATPSQMTMSLVRGSFKTKRLRRSTYAGQVRTKDGVKVQKPSLKKYAKMADIRSFVLTRFEGFTQTAFGMSVNNCVGKKAVKKKPIQLVEEESDMSSGSEDDMD